MVPFRAEVVKVRERTHASLGKFLCGNLPILISVHNIEHGAHDVVRLLAVCSLVGGMFLRVRVVYSVNGFDLISVKLSVSKEFEALEDHEK